MSPAKAVQRKRRRKTNGSFEQPLTVSRLWKVGVFVGGFIVTLYAIVAAWTGFGWWVPAGVDLVDAHITKAVAPIASKVDQQGVLILNGRLETLRGQKQQQEDAKARLDLQKRTSKDQLAQDLIKDQQKNIDDTIKGIDDQIARLSAQVQRLQ